jgi:hypothetical protein
MEETNNYDDSQDNFIQLNIDPSLFQLWTAPKLIESIDSNRVSLPDENSNVKNKRDQGEMANQMKNDDPEPHTFDKNADFNPKNREMINPSPFYEIEDIYSGKYTEDCAKRLEKKKKKMFKKLVKLDKKVYKMKILRKHIALQTRKLSSSSSK